MSLRSILGKSRVKKRSSPAKTASSTPSRRASASPSTSGNHARSHDRRRQGSSAGAQARGDATGQADEEGAEDDDDDEEDFFHDKLDDHGLARALAADAALRDVVQALRHIRAHMFSPLPGLGATRTAVTLNFRRRLPRMATAAHVQALLGNPTAVERETAELVRAGVVRRIVVPRRGLARGAGGWLAGGEMLVEQAELEAAVATGLGVDAGVEGGTNGPEAAGAQASFLGFLGENPGALMLDASRARGLSEHHLDRLVRAGFLTLQTATLDASTTAFSRPEDKVTLTSLETVARAASGSLGAVGGEGVVHAAGGSGGKGGVSSSSNSSSAGTGLYAITVPGTGAFLKLASAALAHLGDLLAKSSRHREATETWLRHRWDGGGRRAKKWKEFHGLAFDWVLGEAVGAGLVEVFETGSVGRGVRLR